MLDELNSQKNPTQDYIDGLDLIIPQIRRKSSNIFRIDEELAKESDRGCAMVVAAFLEKELTDLLNGYFIEQSKAATQAIFEFNGPLGTFSSKIKMAHALGILSQESHNALHLIRKIRNEFAHFQEPLDFETHKISQRISQIIPTGKLEKLSKRDTFIYKTKEIIANIHLALAKTYPKTILPHENITIHSTKEEYDLEMAARHLMKTTAPEISYEQAIKGVKSIQKND